MATESSPPTYTIIQADGLYPVSTALCFNGDID